MLRIKVLRVRSDHSVQVSVHGLLRRASPLSRGGCVWAHETFYICAASSNSSCRVAQVNQLSLLVEILALFACSTIDLALPKHVSILLQAALTSLNFELRINVTPSEIVRIVRDETRVNKVCGSPSHSIFIDINQAEVRGFILHLHELDNAFSRVCKALLALHDAFQFFLLHLDRLLRTLIHIIFLRRSAGFIPTLPIKLLVRVAPSSWYHFRLGVHVGASVPAEHFLRCLHLRIRHPSLGCILWKFEL